jgi:hypothetical protein
MFKRQRIRDVLFYGFTFVLALIVCLAMHANLARTGSTAREQVRCARDTKLMFAHIKFDEHLDDASALTDAFGQQLLDPSAALSEVELDLLYSSCDARVEDEDDTDGATPGSLAVIVPFIHSQLPRLIDTMRRWNEFQPCKTSCLDADLLFYYHLDLDCNADVMVALRETVETRLSSNARDCFRHIYFASARLAAADDVYGIGTVTMFYSLFANRWLRARYTTFYYHEPDVGVIRASWLSALRRVATHVERDNLWMLGSVVRATHFLDNGWGADHSINGNAMYRLGS